MNKELYIDFYTKYLFSLRSELQVITHNPIYGVPGNWKHKLIISHLTASISLLENLCHLSNISTLRERGASLVDLPSDKWNSIFEDFWNFKKFFLQKGLS